MNVLSEQFWDLFYVLQKLGICDEEALIDVPRGLEVTDFCELFRMGIFGKKA